MSNIAFFTDLDDTLLQSNNKVPKNKDSLSISKNRQGEFIGKATKSQIILKEMMEEKGWIIPVTGRNKDALYRIDWNWNCFQAVSHGAIVLNRNGALNEKWISEIQSEIDEAKPILESLNHFIEGKIKESNTDTKVLFDQGIPVYISVKNREEVDIEKALAIEVESKVPSGWRVHLNGRNMAVLPPYASKSRAVKFIKKELNMHENTLTIGL